MSLKLDDLIGKKKEVAVVLDLSKATANNQEEFKRVMEKVPDFKVKPEKIKPEDVKIQDRPKRWSKKIKKLPYQFADPIPVEMRPLRLEDLCSVQIQWNMLTTLRPKTKGDEEYFSRLVELGKLELATQQKEKKIPMTDFFKKMKNRAGVVETRFLSCNECGEDFCQREVCHLLQYENFKREPLTDNIGKKEDTERGRAKTKSKKKRKKRSKSRKSRSRGRSKSKSSTRSKSRGRSKSVDSAEEEKTKAKPTTKQTPTKRSTSKSTSSKSKESSTKKKTGKTRKGSNSNTRKPKNKNIK